MTHETEETTACAKCERNICHDEAVAMWDGLNYCRGCVSSESPELLRRAESCSELADTTACDKSAVLKGTIVRLLWMVVGFLTYTLTLEFIGGNGIQHSVIVLPMLILFSLVSIPFSLLLVNADLPRTIAISNGCVHVKRPKTILPKPAGPEEFELEYCQWEIATSRKEKNFAWQMLPRRLALVLHVPSSFGFWKQPLVCCLDESNRELWESFFNLIDLPRKTRIRLFW